MSGGTGLARRERLVEKISARVKDETRRVLAVLRARPDYSRAFDYFLEIAETGDDPEAVTRRTGRDTVNLLCAQAPAELIHAAGFQPFRVWSGSSAGSHFSHCAVPALMCPLLKASVGAVWMNNILRNGNWIIPTTCDWTIKFPEMAGREYPSFSARVFWLDLPHLKDAKSAGERWLGEIYRLKKYLEDMGGKIGRRSIAESIELYKKARRALVRLSRMRRDGLLAPVWFMLIAGTFFLDTAQNWTAAAESAAGSISPPPGVGARVFLAGSPIVFPNFKLPFLLEESGLWVAADDLCSSERIIPGAAAYKDASEFGMISALAERYHRACLCPTFIDNDRRPNNILGQTREADFGGVVFHVLKGCHPYDIESLGLENPLKDNDLRFIRIETDYAAEDVRNLSARLEAFRGTLGVPRLA